MHIATIKVSTKKGHEQTTRWHVSKSRPYPDRDDRGEWRNAGDMLPRDKSKPSIGNEYRCFLLRSDFDPAAMATGNRNDHAGFSPGLVYVEGKRVMQPELPGTIELRGKSLGEMNIVFGNNPEWPDITVRGYGNAPTTAERDWIKAEIIPALRQFIADNADSLKAQAVAELKKDTAARLASYRADIDRMEAQMQAAIAAL